MAQQLCLFVLMSTAVCCNNTAEPVEACEVLAASQKQELQCGHLLSI